MCMFPIFCDFTLMHMCFLSFDLLSPSCFILLPFCVCFLLPIMSFFALPNCPLHSIGTRELVTQKNLSGLVPIRDFRLDPSLLYSIPLLAFSPNLLIVWLFLSVAYLVSRFRCKWRWGRKMYTWKYTVQWRQRKEFLTLLTELCPILCLTVFILHLELF